MLSNQELVDFLESRACLCWCVSVNSEEGICVSYALQEPTYLFLALFMLKGTWMTIIWRQEGEVPPPSLSHFCLSSSTNSGLTTKEELMARLDELITNNEPELIVLRAKR